MNTLGMAIRYLETEDLDEQPVESVGDSLIQLEGYVQQLEVERSRRIANFDDREGHNVLGYPTAIAFLKDKCRMTGGRAKHLVSVARTARRFKSTFLSWKHGQISIDQAHQLFRAAEQMPDKYPDAEPVLLEIVGDTPEETRQILDYWRHSVDKAGVVITEERQLERRRLDVSRKANGMVSGSFEMTGLAGETLMTALDALQGWAGGLHETESGHVLAVETIRQLACDASVSRIVFGPNSEVLDVGRKTRVIPTALRRAVIARDRHCTHQGCDRPARWCDVHHKIHWADGGETCLENLRLLCRFHHSLTHHDTEEPVGTRSI